MAGMDTSFSYQVRVAACDRCGAPSEATVSAGNFVCRFCNAPNHVDVRDEALVAQARAPISEAERIQRLRMQDGKPLLPPPGLAALMDGPELPEWKVDEAIAIWNASRQELRVVRSNYEAAERLVFLSMVLAKRFQEAGDKLRQRSMLEGALDVVSLPRHRQILRGFLARAAVRSGDLAAAEAWLRPCDPQSDDLSMDSAWRFSRAFIDTAKGDFQNVLRVLGQGAHDVPIADASDDVCAVFRANAWERLGRPDVAVTLLRERMGAAGGHGRQTIDTVIRLYADWHVCATSYPRAATGYAQVAGAHAAKRASGGIQNAFLPLGILMAIAGVVCLVVAAVTLVTSGAEASLGLGFTGALLAFMGVVFGGIGFAMKKAAEKAAWLRANGISARGRIQSVSPTGVSINDVPQVMFTILVELPGRAPYQAQTKALMSGGFAALGGGGMVPLRVHPHNPSEIIIEMD